MIRVCIFTSVHSPFDTRIFHKEAKSLVVAGYDVMLIAQHDKEEVIDGIRIVPFPKPKGRMQRMTKTAWQVYRKARKINADIYHFHDPELIPVGIMLKSNRKKVIYDVHEDVPRDILSKYWIPKAFRNVTSKVFEIFEDCAAKRFNAVITATPFIRERFLKEGCEAVDICNFPLLVGSQLPEADWSQKERAVCYVGGISEIRGIYEMVEAIGETRYKLLLAGDFEPNLRDSLKQLSGWRQVEANGFVTSEGVRDMMLRSMAGLVLFRPEPNHIDSQPNKMFEYMLGGIPIIASNFPLWREIVEGNQCGICVNSLNPVEIAKAIQWIVEHPEAAKKMGMNGRRIVEKEFNWEIEKKKLLRLYETLVEDPCVEYLGR